MAGTASHTYDFYSEEGTFKFVRLAARRTVRILEVRPGVVYVLNPGRAYWNLQRVIGVACAVVGSIVAGLAFGPFEALGASLPLSLLGSFLVLFVVAWAVITAEQRLLWAYLARHSPDPGLVVKIEGVEYHHVYHTIFASSAGRRIQLTVAASRGRLRRAIALAH